MTDQGDPLFDSAQPALQFCYRFASEQYEQSLMARMARKSSVGDGRGLSGLDGAGQAGIIRDIVSAAIQPLHLAILVARCAPQWQPCGCGALCCSRRKRNAEWEAAIGYLVSASVSEFSGLMTKRGLRDALIRAHFGAKTDQEKTVKDLAKRYDSSRDTVNDYKAKIRRWLYGDSPAKVKDNPRKGEEMRAWAAVEELLRDKEIVGEKRRVA